jgi:cysteine protease ATG4
LIISFSFFQYLSSVVYRQDVINLCSTPSTNNNSNLNKKTTLYPSLDSITTENNSKRWLTSVLILVPLRLGLNELDLIYEDFLKEALKLPQTVGIIGGSPRHAVYILGFQDDSFINLDPHFIQTTVNVLENTFDISVRERMSFEKKNFSLCRVIHVHHQKN